MTQRTALLSAAALTAFVVVLVIGLAGQTTWSAPDEAVTTAEAASSPSAPGQVALPAPPSYAVSPSSAIARALSAVPGASLARQPELVDFQGSVAYEVPLASGPVYVDASTGRILFNAAAAAPPAPAPVSNGRISRDQAIQAARTYLGGGTVKEVELERERGITVYEVKFVPESEVYVDAATGQVVYAKVKDERSGHEHEEEDDDD